MDGSCDEFLARPGLAVDQHGGIGGSNSLNLCQQAAKNVAIADYFFELQLSSNFVLQIDYFLS